MMKKMFCALLALVLALCTVAMAEDVVQGSDDQTAETTLTVNVGNYYVVKIPSTLPIAYEATSTPLNVEVTRLQVPVDGKLVVSTTAGGSLENPAGGSIAFTVSGFDTGAQLEFDRIGSRQLSVDIEQAQWLAAPAGNYTGTITFNLSIAE